MTQNENCIFCKIARGAAPAIKIFEDEHSLAFMDIHPSHEGHALVITKAHFEDVLEITPEALAKITLSVQRLARAIDRALAPDGIRIGQFNRAAAGQTVFHYHVHVVPIQAGQSKSFHGRSGTDPEQLAVTATRIRQAL